MTKLRYSLENVDLAKVRPDSADLSHLPLWLREDARSLLRRMDIANKATNELINCRFLTVEVDIEPADLWKHEELGNYELVYESDDDQTNGAGGPPAAGL
jgi:hypothetical protein